MNLCLRKISVKYNYQFQVIRIYPNEAKSCGQILG